MDLISRISFQHLVLRDQTRRAFGEKYLVAELEGCAHLATLDQVSMGFENGIDLLGIGHVFSVEYAAACLINDPGCQNTIVRDLLANACNSQAGKYVFAARLAGALNDPMRIPHNLLGNTDERPVCPGLTLLPLPAGHTLDLLHPAPRRARVIAKTLDTPPFHGFGQVTNRARDDAHHVPQQRVVGRMVNVGLHHRGVDPQLATVLQTKINRCVHDKVVDSSDGIRPKPVEVAMERMVPGYRLTIKIRELAQRHSIRDAFTQFTVVPILNAFENE